MYVQLFSAFTHYDFPQIAEFITTLMNPRQYLHCRQFRTKLLKRCGSFMINKYLVPSKKKVFSNRLK